MSIHMAQTIKEERLRWVLPIVKGQISITDAVRVCPYSQRSLERWVSVYRREGALGLLPRSTRPRTHERETPIHLKERVITLRKKQKLCALKLKWMLAKEGVTIHERTIGKILKQEGLVRTYRRKKVKYKYIKASLLPGELIEIDVKYVPQFIEGKRYYQYTAIDCASRWRHLAIYDQQTNHHSIRFLEEVIERFPYTIKAVKTDNGAIFTNYYTSMNKRSDMTVKTLHALDLFCHQKGIIHYLIDPGKPAQNGKVERSHRSDQESFYDRTRFRSFPDLRRKIKRWNIQYNDLMHCALEGKTPNEALFASPPDVRT